MRFMTIASALAAAALATASTLQNEGLPSQNPAVLYPAASTVWTSGQTVMVRW